MNQAMKSVHLKNIPHTLFSLRRMLYTGVMVVATTIGAGAQKIDEAQLRREVELSENILATLIKQQFNDQTYVPLEITASYQPGYGLTFSLPSNYVIPLVLMSGQIDGTTPQRQEAAMSVQSGTYSRNSENIRETRNPDGVLRLEDREQRKKRADLDSIRDTYSIKIIEAAKIFMTDFGDMLTQLPAQERIVITNQGSQPRTLAGQFFNTKAVAYISVEAIRSDMLLHKQGKITRQQAMNKIKTVNAEVIRTVEPDLELMSSIFTRLYRVDLAKTYFIDNNVYFEHLRDFGAIYYMQVKSTTQRAYGSGSFDLPTVGLENVDLTTRNKKVTEMYPAFERELMENILEYGRSLKVLNNEETLIFRVSLTPCPDCGIPSTLEVSMKSSVLKDYQAGKITKDAALGKFSLKKGTPQ
jgi:hypothetical protein